MKVDFYGDFNNKAKAVSKIFLTFLRKNGIHLDDPGCATNGITETECTFLVMPISPSSVLHMVCCIDNVICFFSVGYNLHHSLIKVINDLLPSITRKYIALEKSKNLNFIDIDLPDFIETTPVTHNTSCAINRLRDIIGVDQAIAVIDCGKTSLHRIIQLFSIPLHDKIFYESLDTLDQHIFYNYLKNKYTLCDRLLRGPTNMKSYVTSSLIRNLTFES